MDGEDSGHHCMIPSVPCEPQMRMHTRVHCGVVMLLYCACSEVENSSPFVYCNKH